MDGSTMLSFLIGSPWAFPGLTRGREEDGQGGKTAGASGHRVGWDITHGQGEHSTTQECWYWKSWAWTVQELGYTAQTFLNQRKIGNTRSN